MNNQPIVHSNAFNFLSFLNHGVDPRTGQYTLGIELLALVGNFLIGPSLPLRLAFNALTPDDTGFGKGWTLNLSRYIPSTGSLQTHTGEQFHVDGGGAEPKISEQKLKSFRFLDDGNGEYRVVHRAGMVEQLNVIRSGGIDIAVPHRVYAPSGRWIELSHEGRFGEHSCLSRIVDGSGLELLSVTYTNTLITYHLHPGFGETRYEVALKDRWVERVTLPSHDRGSWRFSYETSPSTQNMTCLSRVETPLGGIETISYDDAGHQLLSGAPVPRIPRVKTHTVDPGAHQPPLTTTYRYPDDRNFLGFGSGLNWEKDKDNLYRAGSDFTYEVQLSEASEGTELRKASYRYNRHHLLPVITDANVASIVLTLPEYSDRAVGDHVYWWVSKEIPEGEPTLAPEGDAPVTQADQMLPVKKTTLEALGDGEAYVVYLLMDKAGNKTLSLLRKVSITLGALPTVLLPPEVPLARDGLVDREDVMLGITIEIPDIINSKPTDEFNPCWGSEDLGWRAIGLAAFPIPVSVDSAVVRDQYGKPEEGTKPISVSYQVRRGIEIQGDAETSVDVNFEMIGPVDPGPDPDPEWPDPVNPRLPLPHVYGDGSTTPDVLGPEHDKLNAELRFNLYEGLMEGDVVQFFWGGEHVVGVDYKVLDTDNAGDEKKVEILWEYINRTGNTTVPVHYEISRASVPNKGISKSQDVVVNAVVIHPDAPEFVGVNAGGWMTCSALDIPTDPSIPPAILVTVKDLSQYGLTAGSKVHLYWRALHSTSGDEEVIAWDEEITLGAEYPASGFDWRIAYEDYVLPIYDFDSTDHSGRGFVRYEFESVLTASGKRVPVISDEGMAKFAMHGTTDPCNLP